MNIPKALLIGTLTTIILLIMCQCDSKTKHTPKNSYNQLLEQAYIAMDSALMQRKTELIDYLNVTKKEASNIKSDKAIINFFLTQLSFNKIEDKSLISKESIEKGQNLAKSITNHFIFNYPRFYDMLMIDTSGNIFFTIRNEKDNGINIFDKKMHKTALSKHLSKEKETYFVDFAFYEISKEPSSFFIEPLIIKEEFLGWIVMQFSLSKISAFFSKQPNLSNTVELIMVNENHYMLTNSRFKAQSTILSQKLSEQNLNEKFALGKGSKKVMDYQGIHVISVFDTLSFHHSKWLLIAKMNKFEISTCYLKNNPKKLEKIIKNIPIHKSKAANPVNLPNQYIQINIDEFKRSNSSPLYTQGISECTGVLAYLPDEFAYLAHISPYDNIYGNQNTDIVAQIINKIRYIEIPKSKQQLVNFIIVAPHKNTAFQITKKLIESGYYLNQIKIAHNPNAKYVNILHLPTENSTYIEYQTDSTYIENASEIRSLGWYFSRVYPELETIDN